MKTYISDAKVMEMAFRGLHIFLLFLIFFVICAIIKLLSDLIAIYLEAKKMEILEKIKLLKKLKQQKTLKDFH